MVLVIILLLSSYFQSFYIIFFYLPKKNIIEFCLLSAILSWTNTIVVFQIYYFISLRQSLLIYPRWPWIHNPFALVYHWDCKCAKCDLKNVNSSKPVSTVFLVFRLLKIFLVYFLLSFEDWWNFFYVFPLCSSAVSEDSVSIPDFLVMFESLTKSLSFRMSFKVTTPTMTSISRSVWSIGKPSPIFSNEPS